MSSLATQLAQNASLNVSKLVDRSRRKPTLSYLFTGRDADEHDIEAIYALGVNSLLNLSAVDKKLMKYENALFSERAKETDRTLLPRDAVEELDKEIEEFLWLLGPHLLEPPTGKILEWLVRRFRIHEFNIEAVLSLFLPYHESPHFAKMVTLLQIKPNSTWSFLIPYKSAAQKLPRTSLVTEMLKNSDVARFIISLLPTSIKKNISHRVLLAFNAATIHDFLKRIKSLDEGTIAFLLPALLDPLQQKPNATSRDAVLGSYILLASLSQKCKFAQSALKLIIEAMASSAYAVQEDQFVNSVIALCEPQDELGVFTNKTLKALLHLPNFQAALLSGSRWTGSEKFLSPLVKGICDSLGDEVSQRLLEAIIATPSIPIYVIDVLTKILVPIGIQHEAHNILVARRFLSLVQQRYPNVLQKAMDSFLDDDDTSKEALEQLVISLYNVKVSGQTNQEKSDIFLSSSDADATIRTIAVKTVVQSIAGKELSSIEDVESVRDVMITRVQDTNVAVLDALYANPSAITPIFSSDPHSYVASLSLCLSLQAKPKRNILRLHLTYLASHFWPAADPSIREEVFHRILFPFLLFTKPRQKTAELVWEIISEHLSTSSESAALDWIVDCAALVKSRLAATEGLESLELMNQLNFSISTKIAENILESDRFPVYFDSIVTKLKDENAHVKLLAHLIGIALLKKAPSERQMEIARKVMDSMALDQLSGVDDLSQEHLALRNLDDMSFGKYIVTKPNGKTAIHWLEISTIAVIAQIPKPKDLVVNWLMEPLNGNIDRGQRYVSLMRAIYQIANVSATLPILSTSILQLLFLNLGDSSLAFLAGIWTYGPQEEYKDSRGVSLLHAAAFLEAHNLEDDGVDFQTILPALLVALQSSDSQVCQGALECISRIRILTERKMTSVYQFDVIYGQSDRNLQYLDQDDLKRYLGNLLEHGDHFMNDSSYLQVFHEQHLQRFKGDKKRDTDYKHHVICYLLSHINALTSEAAQNALLKSIATITNKAKIQVLLPAIQCVIEKAASHGHLVNSSSLSEELTTRLLACFDAAATEHLNESAIAWDVFLQAVLIYLRSGTPLSLQQAVLHSVESGLFSALHQQRKVAVCETLLEVGARDFSTQSLARKLLSNVLSDVPLILHLLNSLAPDGPSNSPRASKRVKTTEPSERSLHQLSLLVEILATKPLPGSLELLSCLLDTLNKFVQALPVTQADVSYIEQLLMSAIESTASNITEVPNISPSVIRLDVLVEVIRVSGNPQTFHQALLLIADLARLAPDSVLYNVMPVFTFMGSNVFHRDDSYSFKVVQQTIDGIVPVMVSSLKRTHLESLDLYIASKEFLRVFTDAATHIPRHRRNNFFAHLVNVLGQRDFAAPICMLLLEKSANRIARQSSDDILVSISLPISVFQHSSYEVQIHTAVELLKEAQRLTAHIIDPKTTQPLFLEGIVDGDHSVSSSTIMKRRAQALITFIGFALRAKGSNSIEDESSISSVIGQLITVASAQADASDHKTDEVTEASRTSLNRLLSSMSVINFIDAVQSMLISGDTQIQSAAFELLAKRLPEVSPKIRPVISDNICRILVSIKSFLNVHKSGQATIHAFMALNSIAKTLCNGEENSMTETVPFVLSATKQKELVASALAALAAISVKLGPRIIPFFRTIISESITVLRGNDLALFDDAFAILHGLLNTIPTFWGSGEMTQIVFLYVDQFSFTPAPLAPAFLTLTKSLAKRSPAKVLLPSLLDIWSPLETSKNITRISAYFEVLSRALQQADRPTVLEHLRNLFKIFLEALDIAKANDQAESRVIMAFREMVVKLNESAFKPLFRRLYDWAFAGDDANIERKVTFSRLYINLLDFFKGLMVPYMSFLLQPFSDILKSFTTSTFSDPALWSSTMETLTRCLTFDDNGFWRDDKLRQISAGLIGQVEVCIRLNMVEGRTLLQDCLGALVESITDDILVKAVNLNVLMHTRSEDSRVRIFALSCSEALWRLHGGKLLGFVSETATFIAECSEDESDLVVKECFKLKDAVEGVAGKIDGL